MPTASQITEQYLRAMQAIVATSDATDELSYYPALSALLTAVGATLASPVTFVAHPRGTDDARPDGGLYSHRQLIAEALPAEALLSSVKPDHGVVEVKGVAVEIGTLAASTQVRRYWERYHLVLITNYREFALIGTSPTGAQLTLERFALADTALDFWSAARAPRPRATERGEALVEYLQRVMQATAPITTPEDVAASLASYARQARLRLEQGPTTAAIRGVRDSLGAALGLKFTEEREAFFRSTLVQTLFYGIFSAWVLWCRERGDTAPDAVFTWPMAGWSLRVPMVRALFEQIATPSRVEGLGLKDVLDWTQDVLNRVDRPAFFALFNDQDAVQYFYEPFLERFDPDLRRELGVWYTPREVVRYQVARIDAVLRDTLGLEGGLAHPDVVVLDACCGTGAYPVEVLRSIQTTLETEGLGAMVGARLKEIAMQRVFGFEIMPAPFIVAHLQLGLLFQSLGVPFADADNERARIYLTNALSGWTPGGREDQIALIPEIAQERDAANAVKRREPILVIVGNPPYNGFPGATGDEERDLQDAYRTVQHGAQPVGRGRHDLYVRFFRMAERRIVGGQGRGVISFISNGSWLDGQSFPGMRERYVEAFDHIWIDNLNGDRFRTGKRTPDGAPDPSIFSTPQNREGIQPGTAIALLVRTEGRGATVVRYRDLWGQGKHAQLAADANAPTAVTYAVLEPRPETGYCFVPHEVSESYLSWPSLDELFGFTTPGVYPARDAALVSTDRDVLDARMRRYFDPGVTDAEIAGEMPTLMVEGKRFPASAIRATLARRGYLREAIVPYAYRPFDLRWLYWEPETKLLDEKRTEYRPHVRPENMWMVTSQRARKGWSPPQAWRSVGSLHLVESGTTCIPALVQRAADLFTPAGATPASLELQPNLTPRAATYVEALAPDAPLSVFDHAMAIMHAPAYAVEHDSALTRDWARIPLTSRADVLAASAQLGRTTALLLAPETPVPQTPWQFDIRGWPLGAIRRIDGGSINPAAHDLDVLVRWGTQTSTGVMPGPGRLVVRDYSAEETAAVSAATDREPEEWRPLIGDTVVDVYVNDMTFWSGVPVHAWGFTMGGYQVLKKWLSYRSRTVLGRGLSVSEALHFTHTVWRLTSLRLLGPALDANYRECCASPFSWGAAIAPNNGVL